MGSMELLEKYFINNKGRCQLIFISSHGWMKSSMWIALSEITLCRIQSKYSHRCGTCMRKKGLVNSYRKSRPSVGRFSFVLERLSTSLWYRRCTALNRIFDAEQTYFPIWNLRHTLNCSHFRHLHVLPWIIYGSVHFPH